MAFTINGKEQLVNGDQYFFIEKHRNSAFKHASRWIINLETEFLLANDSLINDFIEEEKNKKCSYNVLNKNKKIAVIGKSNRGDCLKIGKFVKTTPTEWHGYPSDHLKNPQDIPKQPTLDKMRDLKLINKSEHSKLCRGQKI